MKYDGSDLTVDVYIVVRLHKPHLLLGMQLAIGVLPALCHAAHDHHL